MKFIKGLVLVLVFAVASSCVKKASLTEDQENPNTITSVLSQLQTSTAGNEPDTLKVGDYVYYEFIAKVYTGDYFPTALETHEVIQSQPDTITLTNGTIVNVVDLAFKDTTYNVPVNATDPVTVKIQKELDCEYAPAPYRQWAKGCDLPPYQNYLLYNAIKDEGQKIFYNLKTYVVHEKLPQKLIDENRCYGFANCEIDMNYVEFDVIQTTDGVTQRQHLTNSFSGQLPYLASNPKQCIDTLVAGPHGQMVPYQVCRILVDFHGATN